MRETLDQISADAVKDPMQVATQSRRSQLPKRFYKQASVVELDGEFTIHLDGRPVRTPSRSILKTTNRRVADMLADEWQAQQEVIDPLTMPVTRLINTAIDGVAADIQAVKEDIVRFAGSDLLCYRAESPDSLVALQNKHWDPLIDWAAIALNAKFVATAGIVHVAQSPETMAAVNVHVGSIDGAEVLTALHSLTSLAGSAIIALAVLHGESDIADAWLAAHVDEDWQISQWGEDSEAKALRKLRQRDFDAASRLIAALSK